jgi:hypothetical protein
VPQTSNRLRSLRSALAAVALVLLAPWVQAATFSGINVQLVGSATMLDADTLQLTPATGDLAGAAWATTPLSTSLAFTSSFEFSIAASDFDPMGDGIAFVVQSTATDALGGGGGGIGLENLDAVGFVVQTWSNNRLGFTETTSFPFAAPAAPVDLGAASLITGFASVGYDPSTTTLYLLGGLNVDGTDYPMLETLNIDLASRFGSTVTIGFTGATGLSYADQRVTNFTVTAVPEPETCALLLTGLGLVGWQLRRRTA